MPNKRPIWIRCNGINQAADVCGTDGQVMRTFEEFKELDYARAGSAATEDFELASGPLSSSLGLLPHTVEPLLRKYGLPTKLNKVPMSFLS